MSYSTLYTCAYFSPKEVCHNKIGNGYCIPPTAFWVLQSPVLSLPLPYPCLDKLCPYHCSPSVGRWKGDVEILQLLEKINSLPTSNCFTLIFKSLISLLEVAFSITAFSNWSLWGEYRMKRLCIWHTLPNYLFMFWYGSCSALLIAPSLSSDCRAVGRFLGSFPRQSLVKATSECFLPTFSSSVVI